MSDSSVRTHLREASAALRAGNEVEAIRCYEAVLRQESFNTSALTGRLRIAARTKELDVLHRYIGNSVKAAPAASLIAIRALLGAGSPLTIASALVELARLHPDLEGLEPVITRAVGQLLELTRKARADQDTKTAITCLRAVQKLAPERTAIEGLIARLLSPRLRLARESEPATAHAILLDTLECDPENIQTLRILANVETANGQSEDAIARYKKIVELDHSDYRSAQRYYELASRLDHSGDILASLEALGKAASEDQERTFVVRQCLAVARACLKEHAFVDTVRASSLALENDPNSQSAATFLKNARRGMASEARNMLRRKDVGEFLTLIPGLVTYCGDDINLMRLVLRYIMASKAFESAEELVTAIGKRHPTLGDAHASLARLSFARGDYATAMDAGMSALRYAPGNLAAQRIIGRIRNVLARAATRGA